VLAPLHPEDSTKSFRSPPIESCARFRRAVYQDLLPQAGHFLALQWSKPQAFPAGELLLVNPNIASLVGVDLDDPVNGIVVEHVRLPTAGLEALILLLHFVQQPIDLSIATTVVRCGSR
jgi:hypothetical protein